VTIELIAIAMGVALDSVRVLFATTLGSSIVLGFGLAAHIGASVLDPRDPMEGGGDSWGADDDLATPSTRGIDHFYWLLSWPLAPLLLLTHLANVAREQVSARATARKAIQRARNR
jgi:hypothetical protein